MNTTATTPARCKSMSDIYRQAADILRNIYDQGRSESNHRRYNRVEAIQERYLTNIAQSLGYVSYHEFAGISSRTRYKTKEREQVDKDYYTKVARDVYAAPFDVDRIREAETWEELNPLRNSLYYQNVRPCEGCPFSASTAFCPYTGGATVEQCKERILSVIAPKSSKPIRTKAQRTDGKTRREIAAQCFRLCQGYRYDTPRYRRISEITERYLRAISCQAIGSANYTQMTEKQCDIRHARAIYMQPKSAGRYALTLNGYVIKEGLSLHEARIIYKSWDKAHRRRMHLHHN